MATDDRDRQFEDTPRGWSARWRMELDASKTFLKKAHREAEVATKRFLDRRDVLRDRDTRVNIYSANIQTQEAMLYGKTPKVSVDRRYNDWNDDGARVGSDMLDRLLNADIVRDYDTFASAMQCALSDLLLGGLGVARLRYVCEYDTTEPVPAVTGPDGSVLAPEVPATDQKSYEDVETCYWSWRDYRYSPVRIWADMRWVAYRSYLSREESVTLFGENIGNRLPLTKQGGENDTRTQGSETDALRADPWGRAEVWEIWDKEHCCVWFWSTGMRKVFAPEGVATNPNGSIPDPLGLDGFFPMPRPLVANLTTDAMLPRSDFALVQDLYAEVDELSSRITRITRAMKVAGVYDKTCEGVQRMIHEATENQLIAVDNWAKFVEKGGTKGLIDWMPIDMIAAALDKLRQMRAETMSLADQISGFGDIVRGEQQAGQTATTSAIEAKFASVRMQHRQDEFARFATDLQRLRAEIISKHFDDQTIIERSNVMNTPNRMLAPQGLAALRDKLFMYRIEVKPENISLTDYASLKQERTEVLAAIGNYLQIAGPLMAQMPGSAPGLLSIMQWMLAGVRGGSQIETVVDEMVQQAMQAAQQPPAPQPPDPKLMTAQIKAGAEQVKAKSDLMGSVLDLHQQKIKFAQDMAKMQAETQHAAVKHSMGIQSAEAKVRADALQSLNAVTSPPGGM